MYKLVTMAEPKIAIQNTKTFILNRIAWILGVGLLSAAGRLGAQYDKVAALGSDSALTPIGGPASAPPISLERYDLPDLRPTGELNDQLPKWLQFGLDERLRWEENSASGLATRKRDSYFINRLRVGTLLQPARWFKLAAQLQDARSFFESPPPGPPNNVRWDLKLAYVQLGDSERQRVSITFGRQLIDFNSTVIANSEWRNQARSYDGVTANIHMNEFRAAFFAASVVNPQLNGISHHREGNNIYGAYGRITDVLPSSSIEPFVLWRVAPASEVEAGNSVAGRLDEKAYGLRIRGAGIANFDYRYEAVLERGRAVANDIRAWGTTAGLGYTLASQDWKPRFFAGYDYASGDKNQADRTQGAFDTLFPTAHDRLGIADLFGWQNIIAWRGGATLIPHRRWSLTAQYLDLRRASTADGVYNSSGAPIRLATTRPSSAHLGEELDVYTWYEINRQVHAGVGVAHLFPDGFLAGAAPYTYPYFVVEMFDGKRIR